MKNYLLLLLFLTQSLLALCQTGNDYLNTRKKIDSILHAEKKYKKIVKKISAIPDSIKMFMTIYLDSLNSNGEPIKDRDGHHLAKDICSYELGIKKDCFINGYKSNITYLYHVYYSVNANRILHVSKKFGWKKPY
ncbi:MAG: hypothetical protein K0Q79_1051 [Flavipsychrobacter sp.]|jgi:hypothetical protein|nr:hypothetical protein [Flavipsychrobacter sp.]